jgi:hypothetical protein
LSDGKFIEKLNDRYKSQVLLTGLKDADFNGRLPVVLYRRIQRLYNKKESEVGKGLYTREEDETMQSEVSQYCKVFPFPT